MIIICMDANQRVITDCMTMCGNISAAYVWQSEYVLHTKQFFSVSFFLLLKLFLLYFSSAQINHLYDV